jgi:hypothetical protein
MYYINVENNHSKTYFKKCLKIKFNNNHEKIYEITHLNIFNIIGNIISN